MKERPRNTPSVATEADCGMQGRHRVDHFLKLTVPTLTQRRRYDSVEH